MSSRLNTLLPVDGSKTSLRAKDVIIGSVTQNLLREVEGTALWVVG